MSTSTSVWHIRCGNVIWKRIVNMAYRWEQNSSASVRVERSICRLHGTSLNEVTINRLLHSSVSLFFPDLKGHTFVSRITAATADNNTAKAAHRHDSQGKTHGMEMHASDNEVTKRDVYFPWRSTHARGRVTAGAFTFYIEIWIMTSLEVESI